MTEKEKAEEYVKLKTGSLHLEDWLSVIGNCELYPMIGKNSHCWMVESHKASARADRITKLRFIRNTGQPATESDYIAFNNIINNPL